MKNKINVNDIPIVLSTDDNYAFQTGVAIGSIMLRKKATYNYIFIILFGNEFTYHGKKQIENIKKVFPDVILNYHEIDDSIFHNYKYIGYISKATMLRLMLPELLTEYAECLYLDSDLIVMSGLEELMNQSIENFYVAGVLDWGINENHYLNLNIKDMSQYVNAGVLLLNLRKMREDNLQAQFLRSLEKNYSYADQDILNIRCYGNIKLLPLKYNVFTRIFANNSQIQSKLHHCFDDYNIKEAIKNPVIIHYTGGIKPWDNLRSIMSREWWRCAKMTYPERECLQILENAEWITQHRDWSTLFYTCEPFAEIIIWGYTLIGKKIIAEFQKRNINKICCFCDNDKDKQKEAWNSIQVFDLKKVLEKYKNPFFIIASQRQYQDIMKELNAHGVEEWRMIRFINKSESYYELLEPQYYEYERKDADNDNIC